MCWMSWREVRRRVLVSRVETLASSSSLLKLTHLILIFLTGLVPYGDWVIGWAGGVLNHENDFYDVVEAVRVFPLVPISFRFRVVF